METGPVLIYYRLTTSYAPEVQEADGVWHAHEFSLQDGDIWKWQISRPPPPSYLFLLARSVLFHPHLNTEDNSGPFTGVVEKKKTHKIHTLKLFSIPLEQYIVPYA